MAPTELTDQFREAQQRINLGERTKVARASHIEVTSVLEKDDALKEHGLNPALIGSYARNTSIWPGKDVDVFGKLEGCHVQSIPPVTAYSLFRDALSVFGDRVQEQPRSLKIEFGREVGYPRRRFLEEVEAAESTIQNVGALDFDFSVDVVPAVHWNDGTNWGIPTRDPEFWLRATPQERWIKTNPEALTDLTRERNAAIRIHGDGAYVPTVKAVKQIRMHHLGGTKPSFLYYEFILHEGFNDEVIDGDSWADLTHSALHYLADRLDDVPRRPVCDPVLNAPYQPAPSPEELSTAIEALRACVSKAAEALMADRCRAAYLWRQVFGHNGHEGHDSVFPLPSGCHSNGTAFAAITANPLRGGTEERGFGHS